MKEPRIEAERYDGRAIIDSAASHQAVLRPVRRGDDRRSALVMCFQETGPANDVIFADTGFEGHEDEKGVAAWPEIEGKRNPVLGVEAFSIATGFELFDFLFVIRRE